MEAFCGLMGPHPDRYVATVFRSMPFSMQLPHRTDVELVGRLVSEVRAHFPVAEGRFQGMMVDLVQDGCEQGLTATVGWYHFLGQDALHKMTKSLRDGMVPIVSYWASEDMQWLDGQDINGEDPCPADHPKLCPAEGPQVSNFIVSNFTGYIHHSTMNLSPLQGSASNSSAALPPSVHTGAGSRSAESIGSKGPASEWMKIPFGGRNMFFFDPETGETSGSLPIR